MAEISDDFLQGLKAVRGEFENSKLGKIGNRILAHVFSTFFPVALFGYLFFFDDPSWPPTRDQWPIVLFGTLTLGVGVLLHRIINSRYVFDNEGVSEFASNGRLKMRLFWADIERVDFLEIRGGKSLLFRSKTDTLRIEYYKSLAEAVSEQISDP